MPLIPPPRGRPRTATTVAVLSSVVFHVAVIGVAARTIVRESARAAPRPRLISLDVSFAAPAAPPDAPLPALPGHADAPRVERAPEEALAPGLVRTARPDTRQAGNGGERTAREAALHLSDSVDGLTLSPDPTYFTELTQVSRIDTASERLSREDRRATPNPMELTFVSEGRGTRHARLTPAPSDPAEGAHGGVPVPLGARSEVREPSDDGQAPPMPVAVRPGAGLVAPLGVQSGTTRADYRRSAAVALARPSVKQARASVSTTAKGRPNDDTDSSEEVALAVRSLITASTAGGPKGIGVGGAEGPRGAGEGGIDGTGSRARPSGEGGRDGAELLGIESYAAALTRKVYPYWEDAFPIWARIEGRGGVAVIGVTLGDGGTIRELHVVRGSGIPEFDEKVAVALAKASPYGPLPRALRGSGLELHIAFDAMNPAVGRSGPGPGGR
ncbi:MAG TPA: TonB family protein [Polyangiaceae bacterium]|nr:TonB family protein [Polyangiaceae bacterium]